MSKRPKRYKNHLRDLRPLRPLRMVVLLKVFPLILRESETPLFFFAERNFYRLVLRPRLAILYIVYSLLIKNVLFERSYVEFYPQTWF